MRRCNDLVRSLSKGRWWLQLLLAICFFVSLCAINAELPLDEGTPASSYVRRFGEALLFALPVSFLRRKSWLFSYIAVIVAFMLSQVWYLRNYGNLMPMTSYGMVGNLKGLGPSIVASMRWRDLLILLPPLAFCAAYLFVGGSRRPVRTRWCLAETGITLGLAILLTVQPYMSYDKNDFAHPDYLFQRSSLLAWRNYGFVSYGVFQLRFNSGVSQAEMAKLDRFMESHRREASALPLIPGNVGGRNLIVIIVESLQSWPIGLSVDGVEVTPRLNALIARDSTLYFPHTAPQVDGGRSSDAQFIVDAGLLPVRLGAASSLYGTHEYMALPKALGAKGYESAIFVCDGRAYWNQEAIAESFGFGKLFDSLAAGHRPCRQDEMLFAAALPEIKKMKQPFMAQLVTMSGHDMLESDIPDPFTGSKFVSEEVRRNLVITHYVDRCIGEFLDGLDKAGLLEASVVVIVGDHDKIGLDAYEGRDRRLPSDRFIPFIVVNSPSGGVRQDVIGQIDIYPTLLDIMGVQYGWRGLGHSVLRQMPGGAVYPDGVAVGELPESELQKLQEKYTISDLLIRSDYFSRSGEQ